MNKLSSEGAQLFIYTKKNASNLQVKVPHYGKEQICNANERPPLAKSNECNATISNYKVCIL